MEGKLAALNLLKDWSNILLVVQMGAIGFIGTLLPKTSNSLARYLALVSIVCFMCSVIGAANLLGSLPMIAQRINSVENIYKASGNWGFTIEQSASLQAICLGFGVFFFKAFVWFRRSREQDT